MKPGTTPYLFLLPYLAVFALFWAWPILDSLLLSFQNTRVYPPVWDPGVNWGRILRDSAFWDALRNTLLILVVQVPLMLILATALAVALNSRLLRARGFFRFAFFAPVVVGAVAYSAVFRLLFNQNGAVNAALGLDFNWIFDPVGAMVVIIVALTWRWTGYNAIIILAGLQNIPKELYEAAEMDGASPWQQFWYVTLPSLRPVLLFCLVLSIIGTLQLFTEPWLITNGGPGTATTTLGVYLYRQGFQNINFGYASAIAYVITLLALAFSIIQLRLFGRES
ncbi:MAG: sugar ABC transporter permease [Meiothermus sp.]|uniref:carbohydrate ABC transporter permease n=1 Tax=Meiothermus sp. TaxID=1955249 RepID=UPI0025DC46C3|nr:sugar ABC transporter permease [Meiothermus sp.]MCS7057819.1 sugar ABC transporter permease [Meiothermus sp.]MCX7740852.1 sugar ABC transporter permease [Meiothermus sp.]MDW8481823.1 sugar ABC transporter permease [Meiothermus sp.]